ncbi:MAG: polyprenyl synthetase family protein [Burkholderiales bacterium]
MQTTRTDFKAWIERVQQRVEIALGAALPESTVAPAELHQAMRYAVLGGGKRARPLLAFAAGELSAADPRRLDMVACSVELVHAYSLVHDDLPCMDDGQLRRGKPTCHLQYDEATALLVGDSLYGIAFELLAAHRLNDDPAKQLEMIKLLAFASGSRGMAGGQAIDLASVGVQLTLPELEFMHIHKTGALIRAAILLGAYCGKPLDEGEQRALDRFAKCVGLAFQVVDDILDAESTTEQLGKTAGDDAARNKPTYVSLLGVSAAREMAQRLRDDALSALATCGERANRLYELADFIVLRKS